MKILFIVLSGLFLVSTAVFIILYYKMKKRFSNCQLALNTTQNNLIDLQKKVKEEVFSPNRKGFYKKTINLISTEDKQDGKTGEPYEALVYIKEIDKYMNGLSKIEMTDIEIISGFDTSKFGWVEL